jgi:hypothetical protein
MFFHVLTTMKKTLHYFSTIAITSALLTTFSAHAGLIFTIENPGVQASTVPGVTTETFDGFSLGAFSGASAVGTFSTGGSVVAPNAFGGSFATRYYTIGGASGHTSSTLTLPAPEHYFGMWWPAGDSQNQISFFNGANLLASFNVGSILSLALSPAYFGNPNNGQDSREPFVYLDFTTTGSDAITSIQFNNSLTTGFEMDNFSILSQSITPPGNSLPDGGASLLLLSGAAAALLSLRRKFNG